MAPEKVRIYDLARELGIPNKELIGMLKNSLGVTVKSHSSTISGEEADKLRSIASSNNKPIATKPEPKTDQVVEKKHEETPKAKQPAEPPKQETVRPEPSARKPEPQQTQQPQKQQKPLHQQKSFAHPKPMQQHNRPQRTRADHQSMNKSDRPSTKPQFSSKQGPGKDQSREKPSRNFTERGFPVSGNKYKYKPSASDEGQRGEKSSRFGQKPRYFNRAKPTSRFKPGHQPPQPETQDTVKSPQASVSTTFEPPKSAVQEPPKPAEEQKVAFKQDKPESKSQETTIERKPEAPAKETKQGHGQAKTQQPSKHKDKPGEKKFPPKDHKVKRPQKPGETSQTDKKPKPAPGKPGKLSKKKDYQKKEKFQEAKSLDEIFKKKKPEKKKPVEEEKPTDVTINSPLTIAELGEKLKLSAAEIIKELMMSGVFATLNETIDTNLAKEVSEKLGYTVHSEDIKDEKPEDQEETKEEEKATKEKQVDQEGLENRAPIVTILGHVDHGKTTLLDAIRQSKHKIVDTEAGGITQSIGAYSVEHEGNKIVFIDTPGHKAFTAMRARGAQATDIAILIVAADDGIMPQTIEAINHAKAAEVPIIVAINKVDKAGSDPDKVLQQLTEHNLIPEDWGGDTVTVKLSALKGDGIDDLLEMITLVAELQELKANPNIPGTGVVIESELDKGKGAVARILVQNGKIKVSDYIAIGSVGGKIRALIDDYGVRIDKAGPSTPVEILGLSDVPTAGDSFEIVTDDKTLKQLINERKDEERERKLNNQGPIKLKKDSIFRARQKKKGEEIKELNVIIKSDTDGSAKAVETALQELKSKEVTVKIMHSGVGDVSEADVMLASTSDAMIIGFGVRVDANTMKVASEEGINIKTYDIIYQISEDIEKTMLGLLQPELKEEELGTAEVRTLFTIGKNMVIAGCYVLEGKVMRNRIATVFRDNKEIFKGNLDNLKRFKDDAKEVSSGYECGISFSKFNDLKEGDLIKVTQMVEIERDSLN